MKTIGAPPSVIAVGLTLTPASGPKVKAVNPLSITITPGGGSPFTGEFLGTFLVTGGVRRYPL